MKKALLIFVLGLLLGCLACIRKDGRRQNELRISLPGEPSTLDWSKPSSNSQPLVYLFGEGLLRLDVELRVQPALAQNWAVSADGKTYTFHLRDSKWSDGVIVRAQDFVDSWHRILQPAFGEKSAELFFDIDRAQDYSAGLLKDFSKVGIKALDDKTLQVVLRARSNHFVHKFTLPVYFPQRADQISAYPNNFSEPQNLRGTGAYRLTSWEHGATLLLEPNPYYWGAKPSIAKIYFQIFKDESSALKMYKEGKLDMVLLTLQRKPGVVQKTRLNFEVRSKPYVENFALDALGNPRIQDAKIKLP